MWGLGTRIVIFRLFACTMSGCQYQSDLEDLPLDPDSNWASIFLVSTLWGTGFLGRSCFMSGVSDMSCNSSMSLRHGAETDADSAFWHHCKYAKSIFFFCKPHFKILTRGNDNQHGYLMFFWNFYKLFASLSIYWTVLPTDTYFGIFAWFYWWKFDLLISHCSLAHFDQANICTG